MSVTACGGCESGNVGNCRSDEQPTSGFALVAVDRTAGGGRTPPATRRRPLHNARSAAQRDSQPAIVSVPLGEVPGQLAAFRQRLLERLTDERGVRYPFSYDESHREALSMANMPYFFSRQQAYAHEVGGIPVGFIGLSNDADNRWAYIDGLVAGVFGKGTGGRLLEAAANWSQMIGHGGVLAAGPASPSSAEFFHHMGFKKRHGGELVLEPRTVPGWTEQHGIWRWARTQPARPPEE
jgi:hypothetical protein